MKWLSAPLKMFSPTTYGFKNQCKSLRVAYYCSVRIPGLASYSIGWYGAWLLLSRWLFFLGRGNGGGSSSLSSCGGGGGRARTLALGWGGVWVVGEHIVVSTCGTGGAGCPLFYPDEAEVLKILSLSSSSSGGFPERQDFHQIDVLHFLK